MIEPSRWREISRRTLTVEELAAVAEGTIITSDKPFDVAVVTKVKESVQITYERIPYDPNRP